MPWKDATQMSLRLEFARLACLDGANVRELCRRFGVSPKTAYKWLARFRAGGAAALADRSRRPAASPGRTAGDLERAVLALREAHPAWGGRKLRRRLLDLGHPDAPSASTVTAILRRHGRLGGRAGRPRDWQRFEHEAPNRLWQMDFKGHFALAGGGRCHPLTVLDDHSRYLVALAACPDERDATVRARLAEAFRLHGLPDRLLCDNGPPWGGAGADGPYTSLGVWLLRLGVAVGHGRPYHPQTQGKDERLHRTLAAEVLQGRAFPDLAACQRAFDAWRPVYNHERPHEALALAAPGSRYRVSPRPFPEAPPPLEYGPGDAVRRVQADGTVSFRGRAWKVGGAFRGEPVAVRATSQDGVWAVYFGVHAVASLDLRGQNEPR
jgi:transposase InsO family protein